MKKIDLGQTISILANLGVIAGIAFLAVEISQNSDQLAAQTRNSLYESQAILHRDFIYNTGGIADLIVRERRGEALTEVESIRLISRRVHIFRTLEHMFRQDPEDARQLVGFRGDMFRLNSGMMETWESISDSGSYDPEFVQFIEEYVSAATDRVATE